MLAVINIWLDVIGTILALGMTFGFVLPHFIGSILTGRVRKHFVENYWDPLAHRVHDPDNYHYKQPISNDFPPATRVWHWVNLVSFMILLISGLYVRYPFMYGARESFRFVHYIFMWIITVNVVWRLIYFAKVDWRNYLLFDRSDIPNALAVAKYYVFLGPPYEHRKKFNPLQRPTYPMLWLLLLLQAFTGFIIFRPSIMPGFLSGMAGGPAAMAAFARLVHSTNTRLMVTIATVHAYLGTMEDYPVLALFWFWREPDLSKYEHEDHGHDDHDAHNGGHDEAMERPAPPVTS